MKLLNPTVSDLVAYLQRYAKPDAPIGCHSSGNGIDIRFDERGVQLVGFNEKCTDVHSRKP